MFRQRSSRDRWEKIFHLCAKPSHPAQVEEFFIRPRTILHSPPSIPGYAEAANSLCRPTRD